MSIYRRCSATCREFNYIPERIDYVWDKDKTADKLCHTWGVDKNHVYEDMIFVKQLYCKLEGRQYLHWVLSHDKGVSPNVADKVAIEVMKMIGENYQLIVSMHTNTENVHTHFLINSVSYITGKKFSESKGDMMNFRKKINRILRSYGLDICGKIESVSEENLDESESKEQLKVQEQEIKQSFSVYNTESGDDYIFKGYGAVEGEKVYFPGILYGREKKRQERPLIPGMIYEYERNEFEEPEKELIQGMMYERDVGCG